MDGELLSLKWNNHKDTFLQVIGDLRRKYESPYADATIVCDGNFYPVHRLVLSSCSDYFSSIFDVISSKNPVIVLKDIDGKNLEYLLDYMYIGEVNVRHTDLGALVGAAESLKIKGLAVSDDEVSAPLKEVKHSAAKNKLPTQIISQDLENKRRKYSKHSDFENNNNNEKSNDLVVEDDDIAIKVELEDDESCSCHSDNNEFITEDPLEARKVKEPNEDSRDQVFRKYEVKPSSVDEVSCIYNKEENYNGENFQSDVLGLVSEVGNSDASSHQEDHMQENKFYEDKNYTNSVASTSDQFFDPSSSLQQHFNTTKLCNAKGSISSNVKISLGGHFLSSNRHRQSIPRRGNNKNRFSKFNNLFSCHICSYTSKEKAHLKRHIMTHTGEKPFKCSMCDYRSVAYHTIKRHFRIHTGEKPFACPSCEYRCTSSETLRKHLLKHS